MTWSGWARHPRLMVATALMVGLAGPGCGSSRRPTASGPSRPGAAAGKAIQVVAAENFWGSIATQVGGALVEVTSIITNPNADPHAYEPTPGDGRAMASAEVVIVNGIGYDPWALKLLAADRGRRTVINVGDVVGVGNGGNPHRWYNPGDVQKVIAAYVAALSRLDPADTGRFAFQVSQFNAVALHDYNRLIADIRARYSGTPVGASESILSMLAPALGLVLVTPDSFLKAVSEGGETSAGDKAAIDGQIKSHLIKIYAYNKQNSTPDIQAQLKECRAAGIPTATITETLVPATATYQAWQTAQLRGIDAALAEAAGR